MTYYREQESEATEDRPRMYIMSFMLQFPHAQDTVYLAHCYPYRYSDMMLDLERIRQDPKRARWMTQKILCHTLAGNEVPLLTITSPKTVTDMYRKQVVVLTSRVHPGESPASWIMRGIIHYLTGDTEAAEDLRKTFIFKIVPMLNPDGVIVGNTRCNLAAADLNRQYKHCVKEAFPTVHYVKEMMEKLVADDVRITLYCDLHAHSRKYNVFMYGCENRKKSHMYLKEQIFPYMLGKNAKDRFHFEDCKFTVTRDKAATGRVVFKNLGIVNSFTLEASYGGSSLGNKAYSHFSSRDYENMGRYFCETLLDFNDPSPPKDQLRYKIHLGLLRHKSTATDPINMALDDYSSLSSCDDDYAEIEEEDVPSVFLFQRVKKKLRRRLRKKKLVTPFSHLKPRVKKDGEETPSDPTSSSSSSESSSEFDVSDTNMIRRASSARCSLHSMQGRKGSTPLEVSEISEDEDAIRVDIMRSYHQLDIDAGEPIEFSASACQKIHAELAASVNKIYMNLSESGFKKSASSSSSSLQPGKKKTGTITKTKSIELKPNGSEIKKERSSSIAEITLQKSVLKRLKKKVGNSDISEEDKSNPDLFTKYDEKISLDELALKKNVIKRMKKKMPNPDISEENKTKTELIIVSEDRIRNAVLKKMKKKRPDSAHSFKPESQMDSTDEKLKGFQSGKMEVFIKKKMVEKRPRPHTSLS